MNHLFNEDLKIGHEIGANSRSAGLRTKVGSAWLRGLWRLLQPLRYAGVGALLRLPGHYRRYISEFRDFNNLGGDAPFEFVAPSLFDQSANTQSGGGQYFYQDIWALSKLVDFNPSQHHDVGSRIDGFVGQATAICPVVYYDIRPPNFQLLRLRFQVGNIVNLPLADKSVNSLSCLHVAEHVGLGRYGDALDPLGTTKALNELMRVLGPGGQLLLSLPVGRERVEFNSQRVLHPMRPIQVLNELRLKEFKAISDKGEFLEDTSPVELINADYSCGLYCFTRD